MKKILYSILIFLFVILPTIVFADENVLISSNSLTIEQGSSKKITLEIYNAIGDVYIKSNNNDIATVDINEWGTGIINEKETKGVTITVTGKKVGSTAIIITLDAASFDGNDLSDQTKIITVNVVDKKEQIVVPSISNNNDELKKLSDNNNIKELSIEGYNLEKINDHNYALVVANNVTSIDIDLIPEDSRSKVSGIGKKKIQIGENNIEVIVISESGIQNKININVTRKDGYYLDDLDYVLNNHNLKDINIIINDNSKITKEQLNKIKASKKIVRLNYFDNNKKLVYSWIINGKNINNLKDFITTITFTTENVDEIYKLSNYADGLYVNFKHSGDLPSGIKVKLYVGNKFKNDNSVNVYHYNSFNKIFDYVNDDLKVNDGYVEFDIEHCSEYFITMSFIGNFIKDENNLINIYIILIIILILIIISLLVFIVIKLSSSKKNKLVV